MKGLTLIFGLMRVERCCLGSPKHTGVIMGGRATGVLFLSCNDGCMVLLLLLLKMLGLLLLLLVDMLLKPSELMSYPLK